MVSIKLINTTLTLLTKVLMFDGVFKYCVYHPFYLSYLACFTNMCTTSRFVKFCQIAKMPNVMFLANASF